MGGPPAWLLTNYSITKCYKRSQTGTDYLTKLPRPRNMDVRFGTWNISGLYKAGALILTLLS
jgi:hypothetical protein